MKRSLLMLLILLHFFQQKTVCQTDVIEKRCTDCHMDIINQPFMHAVIAEGCENCHLSNSTEHPLAGVKGFSLTVDKKQLCFTCHENYTKSNIHAPAKEGECLICHSPHGSANKSLLLNDKPLLCSECHDLDLANKKVKHVPTFDGNCHTCHDPHQSDLAYFLKEEKSKLCMNCHENIKVEATFTNIHPPFSDDCANCHSTHGSENEKLLTEKSPDLCFTCHTDLQSEIENSTVIHTVIYQSKGCANCHSPHASNQNSYLVSEEKELCLNCHDENIQTEKGIIQNIGKMLKKGNFVHVAIENGGCVSCHDPHNSKNSLLLIESYTEGQYTDGKTENFALCFSCHDSGLMEIKVDSTITNFRNGNLNLHFLHLNGNKGHNCNICHNIHGSVFDNLISNKVKFGNWEMPLKYSKEENGGTCSTGCHEEKKYFR